jgi:hypothetical protein
VATTYCAVRAAARPRGKLVSPGAPQTRCVAGLEAVLEHISTVEPLRPTSWLYIGV